MARLQHVLVGGEGLRDYIQDLWSKLVERERLSGLLLLDAQRLGRGARLHGGTLKLGGAAASTFFRFYFYYTSTFGLRLPLQTRHISATTNATPTLHSTIFNASSGWMPLESTQSAAFASILLFATSSTAYDGDAP